MSTVSEAIAKQIGSVYTDYEKLKQIVDLGYFLQDYVVDGGAVTKDSTYNNKVNVTSIVVSLSDDVTKRDATSFTTIIPSTTYYLDYTEKGSYHFDTSHFNGTYLAIAEITTDANGNVNVITDKRGEVGGFKLKNSTTTSQAKTFHANRFISKLQNGEAATVVFLGDSTTELNSTTDGQPNHVGLLETWLDGLYPGLVTVINAGVSGNNIVQMWKRLYKDVLVNKPDLIIVASGINDYGGTYSITLQEFKDNYNMIIKEMLSQTECDVIIRTPNPVIDPTFNTGMEPFVDAAKAIHYKYNVGLFDLYAKMSQDITDGTIVQADLMHDTIHPNAAGHQYIYELFKDYFTPTEFIEHPTKSYKMLNGSDGFRVLNTGAVESNNTNYMNGTVVSWSITGRSLEFEYIGSDLSIVYTGSTGTGQFIVYIDGVAQPLVDTYRSVTSYRQFVNYTVDHGKHTVKIENQATKNVSSTGNLLILEGAIYKKENFVNDDIIHPYKFATVTQTSTINLTGGVNTAFTFNSVVDNSDIIDQDLGTGDITIKEDGLYDISFTNKIVTDSDSQILLSLYKNGFSLKTHYDYTPSSAGTKTKTVELKNTMELVTGDILKFYINVAGTAPTSNASLTITKRASSY